MSSAPLPGPAKCTPFDAREVNFGRFGWQNVGRAVVAFVLDGRSRGRRVPRRAHRGLELLEKTALVLRPRSESAALDFAASDIPRDSGQSRWRGEAVWRRGHLLLAAEEQTRQSDLLRR